MRLGLWGAVAGGLLLGGCFDISVPLIDSSPPHLTNEAVEACKKKAEDLYDDVGERQATPTGEGRYTVVLEVREAIGFAQKTCLYDPKTGAALQTPPAPAAATTPAPAPAETPAAAAAATPPAPTETPTAPAAAPPEGQSAPAAAAAAAKPSPAPEPAAAPPAPGGPANTPAASPAAKP